jgi:hypothetical protein
VSCDECKKLNRIDFLFCVPCRLSQSSDKSSEWMREKWGTQASKWFYLLESIRLEDECREQFKEAKAEKQESERELCVKKGSEWPKFQMKSLCSLAWNGYVLAHLHTELSAFVALPVNSSIFSYARTTQLQWYFYKENPSPFVHGNIFRATRNLWVIDF